MARARPLFCDSGLLACQEALPIDVDVVLHFRLLLWLCRLDHDRAVALDDGVVGTASGWLVDDLGGAAGEERGADEGED